MDMNKVASTSKLCAWNRSRKHVESAPLKKINFSRPKKDSFPREIVSKDNSGIPVSFGNPTLSGNDFINQKLQELKLISPNSAVFTSLSQTLDKSETSGTETAEED